MPITANHAIVLYGLDVMGHVPELQPIKRQYKKPATAPKAAPAAHLAYLLMIFAIEWAVDLSKSINNIFF